MDNPLDDLRAETEYLRQRAQEHREDLAASERALGVPVTLENVPLVLKAVVEVVRSLDGALADRYLAALERFERLCTECERSVAAEEATDVCDAARHAMNDAHEDFERIAAAVGALLDRAGDE